MNNIQTCPSRIGAYISAGLSFTIIDQCDQRVSSLSFVPRCAPSPLTWRPICRATMLTPSQLHLICSRKPPEILSCYLISFIASIYDQSFSFLSLGACVGTKHVLPAQQSYIERLILDYSKMPKHNQTDLAWSGEQQERITIAFLVLAWAFISLRVWTRTYIISNFGWGELYRIVVTLEIPSIQCLQF
jgi:hypothetical protein